MFNDVVTFIDARDIISVVYVIPKERTMRFKRVQWNLYNNGLTLQQNMSYNVETLQKNVRTRYTVRIV